MYFRNETTLPLCFVGTPVANAGEERRLYYDCGSYHNSSFKSSDEYKNKFGGRIRCLILLTFG